MRDADARLIQMERRLARLERRTGTPYVLGKTTMAPIDDGAVQTIQTQFDALSTQDGVPVLYHYGFFANPPVGADVHVSFIDGDRSKAVIVATAHQSHRFKNSAAGDAGLFAHGLTIHLSASGMVLTDTAGSTVTLGNGPITLADASGSKLSLNNDTTATLDAKTFTFNGQSFNVNASDGVTIETPLAQISTEVEIGVGPLKVNGTTVTVP